MEIDTFGAHVEEIPTVNTKMFLQIWDWLEHPQENDPQWHQGDWMSRYHKEGEDNYCGTACCVAGYTVVQETGIVNTPAGNFHTVVQDVTSPDGAVMCVSAAPPGDSFAVAAKHKLGITEREANNLFAGGNTKSEIRSIMNQILEHREEAIRL